MFAIFLPLSRFIHILSSVILFFHHFAGLHMEILDTATALEHTSISKSFGLKHVFRSILIFFHTLSSYLPFNIFSFLALWRCSKKLFHKKNDSTCYRLMSRHNRFFNRNPFHRGFLFFTLYGEEYKY
jgi:hypothetical protein